jgi:hypothetical protein
MFSGGKDLDAILVQSVRRMMKSSPPAVHVHYVERFHAVNRMRAQFGRSRYSLSEFLE